MVLSNFMLHIKLKGLSNQDKKYISNFSQKKIKIIYILKKNLNQEILYNFNNQETIKYQN